MSAPTIALAMVVRNEEKIIERCLRSALPLIDSWVICDTGSSDRTREVVTATLDGIPGQLHDTSWIDFGHNRTELLGFAHGAADYLLLIDADMTVERRGRLGPLGADAYMLRESGPLDFGVIRLVRGNRRWWYQGSTHEHIATDGQFTQESLAALVIHHHADGSARWDKLVRDAALLKRDLARDPRNARSVFYLAQTYRDMGQVELAIAHYRRRVELGGWDEEVFYANLIEGVLRGEQGEEAATAVLLEAWERRSTRAEPLYELARLNRQRGAFASAHMFAERGLEIAYPTDLLFIHRWVYDWGLLFERAMAAAALGRADDAFEDLAALLSRPRVPPEIEEHIRVRLEDARGDRPVGVRARGRGDESRLSALVPDVRIGEIRLYVRPAWPTFNPSIATDGDGFRMIVRTANYAIERGVLHAEGVLHNINYLVSLGAELDATAVEAVADLSRGPRRHPSNIQGYEDCRLFELDGTWYATATVCDLSPVERREIALLRFEGSDIVEVTPLLGPHPERHEKNWMPFVRDGELLILYRCGPTIVLRCDPASGILERVGESDAPDFADEFRGGSQGVPIPGGHLFVVHEVDRSGPLLRYLHRFVMLDHRLVLCAASGPFTFTSDRVEFCAGMARRDDDLVLSFGVSDAAAGLAIVPLDRALGLLDEFEAIAPVAVR
ncbi:MAG: glycosyltransferase [Solirubrobacteraceae bacterium]|jgi:glycosyltransferase involved in cell wall biosynthesis